MSKTDTQNNTSNTETILIKLFVLGLRPYERRFFWNQEVYGVIIILLNWDLWSHRTVCGTLHSSLHKGLLRERNKYLEIIYLDSKTHYFTGHYETDLLEILALWHIMVFPSTCCFVFHRPQIISFFILGDKVFYFPYLSKGTYLPRQ